MTQVPSKIFAAAQRGDATARHELYRVRAAAVFGTCRRYAATEADAEDLAQDTWVKAFGKLDTCADGQAFPAWLHRIAVNTCLMALRADKVRAHRALADSVDRLSELLPAPLQVSPEALAQLATADIVAYIRALPDGFREVFNLVAVEGYTHAEAAEMLGISAATSRSQLTRARRNLRERLAHFATLCL